MNEEEDKIVSIKQRKQCVRLEKQWQLVLAKIHPYDSAADSLPCLSVIILWYTGCLVFKLTQREILESSVREDEPEPHLLS